MDVVWAIIALVTCVGSIGGLIYVSAIGHDDRDREEEARRFFDEHGHWPDEEPPAATTGPSGL